MKFYKIGRVIGRGAFGKVNIGLHLLSGKLCAIKSFNKANLPEKRGKKKIFQEMELQKSLASRFVVNVLETFESEKYILVVMEYISGGDLLSFIKKRSKLTENIAKCVFYQVVKALCFIHSKGVVHRDVKLDNILIDVNSGIKVFI